MRALAKSCNYGQLSDDFIRDRIVVGVRENGLRKKLLQTRELTLSNCIDICRASESTNQQLKSMTMSQDDVHALRMKNNGKKNNDKERRRPKESRSVDRQYKEKQSSMLKCKFCGKTHRRRKEECPAWKKNCLKCGKANHFASQCRSKQPEREKIYGVGEQSDTDSEDEEADYVLTLREESIMSVNEGKFAKRIFAHLVLNNTSVKFQLDSGATVNILPLNLYRKIFKDSKFKQLEAMQNTLVMFNKSEMKVLGKFKTETINPKNQKRYGIEYVVADQDHKPLLGFETIQMLKLMTVNTDNVLTVNNQPKILTEAEVTTVYKDVFVGEGRFEEKLHLEVNKEVPPTKLPVRKVPIALKKPIKEELDRLVRLDALAKVDVPTDWISSMVAVKKSDGSIRLCIDPKPLNKALKRNHYPHPVIEDLLPNLSKAKVFTVLDVQLDQESS